jgi:acetyltransferase
MKETRREKLQYLFAPRSVGILGASSDLNKVSGRPLSYMLRFGFPGNIYPINPKYEEIAGVRCHPSIEQVPGDMDVLMVIIPAGEILPNLEAGLKKGVKAAIIISGGFAEVGGKGKALQEELKAFARRSGMLIYGPNTTGFLSIVHRSVATFSQALEVIEDMVPGPTGLITQSGAFGAAIFVRAMRVGLGISHWAATGNEADLEFCDFLDYMVDDPHTRVIAGFLAGVEDGQKLLQGLDRAARAGKPVVLLKVGGTEAGKRAAHSHTGAMVGSSRAYDAVFRQKGVIVAQDIDELIDFSMALSRAATPKGKRIGIMTESGGGGVLLTERCAEMGLQVSEIAGDTLQRLKKVVPALGSVKNPVDLTGQSLSNPAIVKGAVEVMLDAQDFDMVVPLLLMSEATAERKVSDLLDLVGRENARDKTVVVCWPEGPKPWIQHLVAKGIHVAVTPTRCASTLRALAQVGEFRNKLDAQSEPPGGDCPELPERRREAVRAVFDAVLKSGSDRLTEHQTMEVLAAYGIPIPRLGMAHSPDEAVRIARDLGFPVVAKLSSPEILHKSDAQAVALGLRSDSEVREAYDRVVANGLRFAPEARMEGVLIQEMIEGAGVETIMGISQEPPFGPTLVFGMGGVLVEILKDVAVRVLPATRADLAGMVPQISGYPLLQGVRGRPAKDEPALLDALWRLATLAWEMREFIAEIDVNPLVVLPKGKGVKALDGLLVLRREPLGSQGA